MTDIRELIWQQVEPMLFMTREQFLAELDGWEIESFEVDGEPAFAMLIRGPEFHLETFETGHRFPLRRFLARLQRILDEHGYATTRTPKDLPKQHSVNLAFGFTRTGEDEYDVVYRLDRIPSAKEHRSVPCPQ